MALLEEAVHTQFASHAAAAASSASFPANIQTDDMTTSSSSPHTGEAAFARIDSVVPGSPAQTAGLQAGDRVQRFGDANWLNHEKLARVAQVVAQSEGVSSARNCINGACAEMGGQRNVIVRVSRGELATTATVEMDIVVTPRRGWGGRGLLGCHLLPL